MAAPDQIDELIDQIQAGLTPLLTRDEQPVGVALPFPSDPSSRVRKACALLRAGVIGTATGARLAGHSSVEAFMEAAGALGESIISAEVAEDDLRTAAELARA